MEGSLMKKLFVLTIFAFLMCVILILPVFATEDISVYFDGAKIEFDVKPQIIEGRTMVPIRAIFEKMGASVVWDNKTSTAICTKGSTTVMMTVGSREIYINNVSTTMDTSPVVIDGRTLAPARYVAEAFGANVQWSPKKKKVVICSANIYAYADYPDIPDIGKCYETPIYLEEVQDGFQTYSYVYTNLENWEYHSTLFDASCIMLGNYQQKQMSEENNTKMFSFTKAGLYNSPPSFFATMTPFDDGTTKAMILCVLIPDDSLQKTITLYSLDGRTIDVKESDVEAYLNVGWYRALPETQTLYAADGRTITVLKSEVESYKTVGWYETKREAEVSNRPSNTVVSNSSSNNSSNKYNPSPDGNYYRTPTGKKYHKDPNCGGKNSYRTTNISGLSPCAKCCG